MNTYREEFLLAPEVIFLNHGSFGACPQPVLEDYHRWQLEMERNPVAFLARRFPKLMTDARRELAAYLHCDQLDLVYFTNPTTAVNMIVKSLKLNPGDEILTSNHEYGAMSRTWRFYCRQTGASYVEESIPLPVGSSQAFVDQFWARVTPKTRVIFLSHITSPTALQFPVKEICRRARAAGILTVIDGAHAPGQIPLNLEALGADFYTGACHKWLCAPKGSAFLYARRAVQTELEPLVVSWGYESEKPGPSSFLDHHEWQGTRDLAAFLSVPAAILYQETRDWEKVRTQCHRLVVDTRERIGALTGLPPICPAEGWISQMFAVQLPISEPEKFQQILYERHRIEVPVYKWGDKVLLRCSFQGYNNAEDADALIAALEALL